MSMDMISAKDKMRLRELAKKQMEYAHLPVMEERVREWYRHAAFKQGRPMIHLESGSFEQDFLPERMLCEGDKAREIEANLLRNFLNYELFDDDRVVPDYYGMGYSTYFTLFGVEITADHAVAADGTNIGHHFNTVIDDLEDDWHKLGKTQYGYSLSRKETEKYADDLSELFGDILPVRIEGGALYAVPTQMVVHLMGMETMFFSMYDYPEKFKQMMDRIADDLIETFDWMTEEGLLYPTTGAQGLGNGSFCFTDELPGKEEHARRKFTTKDLWGFMDSQETVGVSPEMFGEFIFPCYEKIAKRYGLLSYGCCEPVDAIWKDYLSRLDNLRKVSISPWCNEEYMGEQLRGRKTIYFRKPSPNFLGVGTNLDEDAFRKHICKTLDAAKGCQLEIAQRDVYSINRDVSKAHRYVEIIRECIEEKW